MAVEAQLGTELVIDPQNVRYSLTVDRLAGHTRQTVDLQRSMKREDGKIETAAVTQRIDELAKGTAE